MELLTHPAVSTAQNGNGIMDGLFDASDRPEGGEVIIWWNDFEKDNRFVAIVYEVQIPVADGPL